MLTNMPWPVPSLVKRVPSLPVTIVRLATAVAEPGVLQGLSATYPARCYGRHPTLRRSGPPGFSKDRRLDTPRETVGVPLRTCW
jgi:hypothetical protein